MYRRLLLTVGFLTLFVALALPVWSVRRAPIPPGSAWASYTNANKTADLAWQGNALWAATHGGLVRWDVALGTYTKYTTVHGLAENDLEAIAVHPTTGDVWVVPYASGTASVRHPDNTWTTYPDTGLSNANDVAISA